MTTFETMMVKFKKIKVTPVLMAGKHYFDFEVMPTFGFLKKPTNYNVETGEPACIVYSVGISWLVFGLAITYKKVIHG